MRDRVGVGDRCGFGESVPSRAALRAEGARVVSEILNGEALAVWPAKLGDACVTRVVDVPSPSPWTAGAARDTGVRATRPRLSAGIGWYSPDTRILSSSGAVMNVCLRGVFSSRACESAAMVPNEHPGVIINIAAINAIVPPKACRVLRGQGGVAMLTRCAAMEWGRAASGSVGIGPGFIETPMTHPARFPPSTRPTRIHSARPAGAPRDIADAAGVPRERRSSWSSGTTIYVDGAEANKGYPELARFIPVAGASGVPPLRRRGG